MYKRSFLIIVLSFGLSNAQITTEVHFTGINTYNPLGVLHVDGQGDNNATSYPSVAEQSNDFIIRPNGNVGVGTVNPNYKLDINTGGTTASPIKGFKLVDGYQQDGFVLTSNSEGVGNWQPIDITIYRSELSGNFTIQNSADQIEYTNQIITLPPGYWLVNLSIGLDMNPSATYQVGSNFLRLRFLDNPTSTGNSSFSTNVSVDAVFPKYASSSFPAQASKGMLNGSLAINNTSGAPKDYYLYVDQFAGTIAPQTTLRFSWLETSVNYFRIADPN